MAKSRETFSKKEKEKKKLKKRRDKLEKKEERKENASNGNNLDDMLAYVDENGNLSTTPPDPMKKKKAIEQEDIQFRVDRQEDIEEDPVRKGTVTFFNDSKGYGFIRDTESQENVFVHLNGLIDRIQEKDKVTFEVERTPKGLSAIKVELAK